MSQKNENGFTHFLMLLLGVAVIAAIAFVGYRVYKDRNTSTSNQISSSVPTEIKSSSDLQQAQKALNGSSLPDPSSLDSDLKNLL